MDKGTFPPAFDNEGGVQVPHVPEQDEMDSCTFAKKARKECPAMERKEVACGTCQCNIHNIAFEKAFVHAT